ncbi:MAG: hypothetical protein ACRDHW_12970, partial [Ktedonobacteraceae bacterium]
EASTHGQTSSQDRVHSPETDTEATKDTVKRQALKLTATPDTSPVHQQTDITETQSEALDTSTVHVEEPQPPVTTGEVEAIEEIGDAPILATKAGESDTPSPTTEISIVTGGAAHEDVAVNEQDIIEADREQAEVIEVDSKSAEAPEAGGIEIGLESQVIIEATEAVVESEDETEVAEAVVEDEAKVTDVVDVTQACVENDTAARSEITEDERADAATRDTVEVAGVEDEARETETVKISAVMLETLKKVRLLASRELAALQSLWALTQRLLVKGRHRLTGSQAAIRRSVTRRWGRQGKRQQRRWVKIVCALVIASILVGLSIPLCVALIGYSTYNNIKGVANDGVNHLLAIKTLIPANKNDLTSVLNMQKLTHADTELSQAQDDFLQLQDMVNRPDIQPLIQQYAPQYSNKLDMARHLIQVALDVSRMGRELIGVAQIGAHTLHGP